LGQTCGNIIRGGNALQPTVTAKTVQVRNGKPSTNEGPAVKTQHQLTGYCAVDARNVDEALAMAAKIPAARFGSIEVRDGPAARRLSRLAKPAGDHGQGPALPARGLARRDRAGDCAVRGRRAEAALKHPRSRRRCSIPGASPQKR
jgi:hypothetical protein